MTTGTSTFSTSTRSVQTKPKPIAKGKYNGTLRTGKLEARGSKNTPGKPVRIAGAYVEVPQDSGKPYRVYLDIYTSLKPGKDGIPMTDRGGQIVQLAAALQSPLDGIETHTATYTDEKEGEVTCEFIDPAAVKAYLTNFDGTSVRVDIGVENDLDGNPTNKVKQFLPAE